eukprot:NODE_19_length_47148_cov_1.447810.p42 type:complete len:111 gc:universal NODE_19_length_47148_cov_1.447810:44422-44754(+)
MKKFCLRSKFGRNAISCSQFSKSFEIYVRRKVRFTRISQWLYVFVIFDSPKSVSNLSKFSVVNCIHHSSRFFDFIKDQGKNIFTLSRYFNNGFFVRFRNNLIKIFIVNIF